MKPPEFRYLAPRSIVEAVQGLDEFAGRSRPLAGGQSLMPLLAVRAVQTDRLLDLNRIVELQTIEEDEAGQLTVGAMTRHRQFERDARLTARLPLLAFAMRFVASVAIRNRGTIGGSLCHADPAAEWPALCLACDADILTASVRGGRRIPVDDFLTGAFSTSLKPGELLTHVVFPAWPARRRWSFQEVPRHVGGLALVGVACVVDMDAQERCRAARVAVFGATERATRLGRLETSLIGHRAGDPGLADLAEAAGRALACRDDGHASAAYRAELVEALVGRALQQVFAAPARAH